MTNATAEVTVHGVPLEVEFTYIGPSRGYRNSMGVPEEPDCPAEVEVREVRLNGWEITPMLDDAAFGKIRDEILRLR